MAPLRARNLASRWQGLTPSLSRPFSRKVISWAISFLDSTKAQEHPSATTTIRITPFERAMQDLFGDVWKEKLNYRGRTFVVQKEKGREKHLLKCGLTKDASLARLARDDEYPAAWHERVQELKILFSKEGQAQGLTKEAISEARKRNSQD